MRVERLVRERRVRVQWVAFPLNPHTPEEGRDYRVHLAGKGVDYAEVMHRLRATADADGVAFGDMAKTYNSRKATELSKWAEEQGCGAAFRMAVFEAFCVRNENIALPEMLGDVCRNVGLREDEALRVLQEGRYASAVDRDWGYSREMGVTGAPTFLMGNRRIVGALPYAELEKWVLSSG